jgi:hypothetical protein
LFEAGKAAIAESAKPDAESDDFETLRKNYKEKDARTLGNVKEKFSDVGNLMSLYSDEVESKGKGDRSIAAALDRGERNFNPALVIQTGKDQYEAIGSVSERITASAKNSKEAGLSA